MQVVSRGQQVFQEGMASNVSGAQVVDPYIIKFVGGRVDAIDN